MEAPNLDGLSDMFPAKDLEWRIQRSGFDQNGRAWGIVNAYVTNRAIQQRLDDCVGRGLWYNNFTHGPCGGMSCGISIFNPVIGEWVTKWDGAGERDNETIKAYYSDSMKRAGVQLGIGRYLYDLPVMFADVITNGEKGEFRACFKKNKEDKGTWLYWNAPKMPKEFLP